MAPPPPAVNVADLPQKFIDWLLEVDPLITRRERQVFLSLAKDYQRNAFIRSFWKNRDPFPQSPRNELLDRWRERIDVARSRFGGLQDDRARVFLLHGPPHSSFEVRCTATNIPAEAWAYSDSEWTDFGFLILFVRHAGRGPMRVYRSESFLALRTTVDQSRRCINGDRLAAILSYIEDPRNGYESKLMQVLAKPKPRAEEWLDTFAAYSTELPAGAEIFPAELELVYPGRYDNRTVLQGMLAVPRRETEAAEFAGYRSFDFVVNGEIILGDELFENFRYQFGFPANRFPDGALPLAFQRYLRPGSYTLVLRVEDLNSGRFHRLEETLEVPAMEEVVEVESHLDSETQRLFEEATAAIAEGETRIRIIPPQGELQTGFVRVDTIAAGEEIARVRFLVDGRPVLTKNRPPFNVQLDLGQFPRRHTIRAEALDLDGREVTTDEIEVNAGSNRFAVKLLEPRRGQSYERSLRARAEVVTPENRAVERVELYLDNDLVATLYQPPYVQPIPLPDGEEISYVRAVAYLPDGNSTEDLVFINAPAYLEELDVQFVELYTTVLDVRGRPVDGLGQGSFQVFEDGVEQRIVRFERVEDLPIHAGILIDNSGSMKNTLGDVRKAALSFLRQAITPRDRAAVITFNKFPRLAVKLTSDLAALGGGLAGLTAEGETALYDSLIFSLYYFTGIRGQRAILLLSDGRDEGSKFEFEEALEYARRAGVTIYAIGLDLPPGDSRGKLTRLAEETGGRSFFIHGVGELETIYESIQEELRSQYLIAYQSSNTSDSSSFRAVELKVDRPQTKVNTISGYYP